MFDGTRAGPGVVVMDGKRIREVVFGQAQVGAGEVVDVRGRPSFLASLIFTSTP